MNCIRYTAILFALVTASWCSQSRADFWLFNVVLDGLQEAPPNASPATGTATVLFDDVTGDMTVNGSFSNLVANAINAHVHGYAPAGVNAAVVFGLAFTPATSGTISGAGIIPVANIADVLNGLTYINIHSAVFPGGEIRGQIVNPVQIPEPSAVLALIALSVGLLPARPRRALAKSTY